MTMATTVTLTVMAPAPPLSRRARKKTVVTNAMIGSVDEPGHRVATWAHDRAHP
jgi:hypothetical protein